jgi:hypothetical protein
MTPLKDRKRQEIRDASHRGVWWFGNILGMVQMRLATDTDTDTNTGTLKPDSKKFRRPPGSEKHATGHRRRRDLGGNPMGASSFT